MKPVLHAVTVRQPWATLIIEGGKYIENRTWPLPERYLHVPLLIHAGKAWDPDGEDTARFEWLDRLPVARAMEIKTCGDLRPGWKTWDVRGAIIGAVVPIGNVYQSLSPWFCGPIGWRLTQPRLFAQPIPCTGKLGLWEVPKAIREKLAPPAVP